MQLESSNKRLKLNGCRSCGNSLLAGVGLLVVLALLVPNRYRLKKRSEDELKRTND